MATASSLQRLDKLLMAQYRAYTEDPFPYALAWMEPDNVKVWHFLAGGLAAPFSGGEYIFRLTASDSYPSVPPKFEMLTPNGVFMPGGPACVAFSERLQGETPSARNAYGWWPDLGMRGFAAQVACGLACYDALEGAAGATEARVIRTPAPMKEALARASWGHNRRFLPEVMAAFEDLLAGMPDVAPARNIIRAREQAPWRDAYSVGWPRLPVGCGPPKEGAPPAPALPASGPPPGPQLDRKARAPSPDRKARVPSPDRKARAPSPDRKTPAPPIEVKAPAPSPRRGPAALRADPDDEELMEAARGGVLDPDSDDDEPAARASELKIAGAEDLKPAATRPATNGVLAARPPIARPATNGVLAARPVESGGAVPPLSAAGGAARPAPKPAAGAIPPPAESPGGSARQPAPAGLPARPPAEGRAGPAPVSQVAGGAGPAPVGRAGGAGPLPARSAPESPPVSRSGPGPTPARSGAESSLAHQPSPSATAARPPPESPPARPPVPGGPSAQALGAPARLPTAARPGTSPAPAGTGPAASASAGAALPLAPEPAGPPAPQPGPAAAPPRSADDLEKQLDDELLDEFL